MAATELSAGGRPVVVRDLAIIETIWRDRGEAPLFQGMSSCLVGE